MLLMIIPFVLPDAGSTHCLAVAPTLLLSLMFIVLYLVDQVHDLAEQLYLTLAIIFNVLALLVVIFKKNISAPVYVLFYCHLLVALCIDQYYVIKERGCALLKKNT